MNDVIQIYVCFGLNDRGTGNAIKDKPHSIKQNFIYCAIDKEEVVDLKLKLSK